MKIVWSKRSKQHLRSLFKYIAQEDGPVARSLVVRIIELAETILCVYPNSGRVGRITDTRELVISKTPYVVAYKVKKDTISIIAVWHSSRRWPDKF